VRTPTYAETVASIVKSISASIPVQIQNNLLTIQSEDSKVLHVESPQVLHSPTMLKPVLQKHFNRNLEMLNTVNIIRNDQVAKIKTAGIQTIQQANLQVENRNLVVQSVQLLLNATTVQKATEGLSTMLSTIKEQHTKVFTNTLANTIQLASSNIGFSQVKLETVTSKLTRIVATNLKGINLISEIHTDERKKVDIVSELEGITDGSCKQTMDAFNKELETLGVVAERKDRKPTGGVPVMEYAKSLNKKRNSRKKVYKDEHVLKNNEQAQIHQHINN
jgi:hypothetical protein